MNKVKSKLKRKILMFLLPWLFPIFLIGFFIFALVGAVIVQPSTTSNYGGAPPVTGEALKVATQIYEHEIKEHKATPQGASGSIAVAQRESGFDVKAVNTGGGVAGIFQWSGFVNNVNGNRITAEGSIKAGEQSTLTLENELKLLDYELNGSYSRAKEVLQKSTRADQAALDWSKYYEGVSLDDPQTKPETIKQLAQQWLAYFTNSGGDGSSANTEIPSGFEASKPLPNLSSYPKESSYPWGQCTWFVYYRALQLGISFSPTMGNGADWQNASDYKVTTTPTLHSALSFSPNQAGADPTYGHVAFVEQVRSDGSILISESNVKGLGVLDYRTFTKSEASQFHYVIGK